MLRQTLHNYMVMESLESGSFDLSGQPCASCYSTRIEMGTFFVLCAQRASYMWFCGYSFRVWNSSDSAVFYLSPRQRFCLLYQDFEILCKKTTTTHRQCALVNVSQTLFSSWFCAWRRGLWATSMCSWTPFEIGDLAVVREILKTLSKSSPW